MYVPVQRSIKMLSCQGRPLFSRVAFVFSQSLSSGILNSVDSVIFSASGRYFGAGRIISPCFAGSSRRVMFSMACAAMPESQCMDVLLNQIPDICVSQRIVNICFSAC